MKTVGLITEYLQAVLADTIYQMLELDIYASDLYESVITDLYGTPFHNELTKRIIKITEINNKFCLLPE